MYPWLSHDILRAFFSRKVEVTFNVMGLNFLASLSVGRVHYHIKNLRVHLIKLEEKEPWATLAKSGELESLDIFIDPWILQRKGYTIKNAFMNCPAWLASMRIRACKEITLNVSGGVRSM
nr:hypothetical protein [uncultured organism]